MTANLDDQMSPAVTFMVDGSAIIVEFPTAPGMKQVSLSPKDLAEKSAEAVRASMRSIYLMSRQVMAALRAVPASERPSQAEVEFGITFSAEAGAILAKAGSEASISVKLIWEHDTAE